MLYNNIKLNNKCIFYMSTCCTSFENLGNSLFFRYVLLGLPSAKECSQLQPSDELTSQVLSKALKISNTKGHVVRGKK